MNPASDYCQRWSKGAHSWRHASEGGFDPRLYDVVPLPEKIARAFVIEEHYAASFPAARFSIGLLTRDERYPLNGAMVGGMALAGVATFSTPMASRVLTAVFPTLSPYEESIELGRFVLTDTPANAESWCVYRTCGAVTTFTVRGSSSCRQVWLWERSLNRRSGRSVSTVHRWPRSRTSCWTSGRAAMPSPAAARTRSGC